MCLRDDTSQELVNLLLLGRAHSNVFDGDCVIPEKIDNSGSREIVGCQSTGDGGGGDRVVLRGAPGRGRVGFLTLFEAHEYVEVKNVLASHSVGIRLPILGTWDQAVFGLLNTVRSAVMLSLEQWAGSPSTAMTTS